jgi:hypothetical protein
VKEVGEHFAKNVTLGMGRKNDAERLHPLQTTGPETTLDDQIPDLLTPVTKSTPALPKPS